MTCDVENRASEKCPELPSKPPDCAVPGCFDGLLGFLDASRNIGLAPVWANLFQQFPSMERTSPI
jgi:hypothetical protein